MRKLIAAALVVILILSAAAVYFIFTVGSGYPGALALKIAQYAQVNQFEGASAFFYKMALYFNPYDQQAILALADIYEKQGNIVIAEKLLRDSIALLPSGTDFYFSLASLYMRRNALYSAVDVLDHASGYAATRVSKRRPQVKVIPVEGSYDKRIAFTLNISPGVKCYYTTDGSVPDLRSLVYSQPLYLDEGSHKLSVIAIDGDGIPSPLRQFSYIVKKPYRTAFAKHTMVRCPSCGTVFSNGE